MVRRLWTDKEFRKRVALSMEIIRTLAAIAAATTLILTHWKL